MPKRSRYDYECIVPSLRLLKSPSSSFQQIKNGKSIGIICNRKHRYLFYQRNNNIDFYDNLFV